MTGQNLCYSRVLNPLQRLSKNWGFELGRKNFAAGQAL
jgi:hypothetical protein